MKLLIAIILILVMVLVGFNISESAESIRPLHNEIAKEVITNNSNNSEWVCLDYAEELNQRLQEQGYDSKVVTGWYDKGTYYKHEGAIETEKINNLTGHAWIEVTIYIESTTGAEIDPELIKDSSLLKNP